MKIRSMASSLALALVLASGCGDAVKPPTDTPIVRKAVSNLAGTNKCSATSTECAGQAIEVTLTLDKARILGREFIYNLDLQYSSQFDEGMNLYTQSEVVGNTPVVFRIKGNSLELVTDNKLKFPSDNNHPEDVIGRFRILEQNDSTITVSGLNSAVYLATQMGSLDEDKTKPIAFLDHWIRSFEFDPNGNYLLQETSLKLSDGKMIVEFMESIYPREALTPGKLFKKFEMDPSDPVGASEGDVTRFRFLAGDTITLHDKTSEQKLAFAQHFDISSKADGTPGTIDWYVTPNIPDEYVAPVKEAVEGWNRYFVKMKGIERPVVRFLGKLPANIRIGDPRYNVINWDSRLIAGAAYESQASDPETGRQSHSLIYMPAAWLKIGTDYWAKGIGSDTTTDGAASVRASQSLKCARDMADAARILTSGRVLDSDLKNFGIQLLKQTLFHEVGHALGFAHNFKGSLSYDPSDAKSMFSTSIMDYNDYELERAAFSAVDSADGPLLEYDRQMMSAIYNESKDITDEQKKHPVPTCNDAEADNEDHGVDPLCVRYDVEKDPTASITKAIQRVENAQVDARDISLSQALSRIPNLVLEEPRLQGALKRKDVEKLANQFATTLRGSLDFYIVSDVAALARTVRTNVKSLYELGVDLPEGYEVQKMRETTFAGIQKILSMMDVPAIPKQAFKDAADAGFARLMATPGAKELSDKDRADLSKTINDTLTQALDGFAIDSGLPAARAKVIAALARHTSVDLFAGKAGNAQVDYENNVVALLADIVTAKAKDGVQTSRDHTSAERIAAAKALATYKGRYTGDTAIAAVKGALLSERAAAPASNGARRTIEAIVKALGLSG